MARIKFFAHFRDAVGEDEIEVRVEGEKALTDVLDALKAHHPGIADILEDVSAIMAVNHQVGDANTMVKDGDEIAIFPPVSGG